MELFFENKNGEFSLVAELKDGKEIFPKINEDIKSRNPNFKVYYIRTTFKPETNEIIYDVGSHTEFYWVKNMTQAQYNFIRYGEENPKLDDDSTFVDNKDEENNNAN